LVAPKHPVYDLFHKIFDGVDFFRKCIGLDAHIDDIIAAPIAKISYGNKLTYL
jgi:hypothetical protein